MKIPVNCFNTLRSAIVRRRKLAQMTSVYFKDRTPLITHSQVLSTFQHGGRAKFPTLRTVGDVKIATYARFMKSNPRELPRPLPPILEQTIDMRIISCLFPC